MSREYFFRHAGVEKFEEGVGHLPVDDGSPELFAPSHIHLYECIAKRGDFSTLLVIIFLKNMT